jgi:hypothetical protein
MSKQPKPPPEHPFLKTTMSKNETDRRLNPAAAGQEIVYSSISRRHKPFFSGKILG